MTSTEPCLSVKEEEEEGEFFIMRKPSSVEKSNTEPPLSSANTSSVPAQSSSGAPSTIPALPATSDGASAIVAAAIQAVTGGLPNASAENPNRLSSSSAIPFVPPLCIPLPAFTVSVPQNGNNNPINPEMKFIVLPVHQCWGCRKEFTDVGQFYEHVNKSMCLPSVNTEGAVSEPPQPSSDTSTSLSDVAEISPGNASLLAKEEKISISKKDGVEINEKGKPPLSEDSVDSVIEGILREIRAETLRREAAGRAVKVEATEESNQSCRISSNDSNNNTNSNNTSDSLVKSPIKSVDPPPLRKRSRKSEPKALIKECLGSPDEHSIEDSSQTSAESSQVSKSSLLVKQESRADSPSANIPSNSEIAVKDLQIIDPMEVDPEHPARLVKAIYTCMECSAEFHTNIGLLRHQSAVHGVQQFPCDIAGCSKVFKNESALSDHKKRVHGPRSFACVHCNAFFTTETYLKAHVKIHMDKKHVCRECNHSFVNKTDLNNHMRVHTGVKPYTCKVCGKAFRHVSGYYTHVRIHTGETPYECEFCHKKFTNASNFQTHRKIHTQDKKFKCEICDKEFIQQSNFTRHKRTHTKERPYECSECGENFSYSTCLKKHLKKDHGIEPLECDQCKRTFLNQSSFVRHRTGCQFKDIVKKEAETDSAQFL